MKIYIIGIFMVIEYNIYIYKCMWFRKTRRLRIGSWVIFLCKGWFEKRGLLKEVEKV